MLYTVSAVQPRDYTWARYVSIGRHRSPDELWPATRRRPRALDPGTGSSGQTSWPPVSCAMIVASMRRAGSRPHVLLLRNGGAVAYRVAGTESGRVCRTDASRRYFQFGRSSARRCAKIPHGMLASGRSRHHRRLAWRRRRLRALDRAPGRRHVRSHAIQFYRVGGSRGGG